MSFGTKKYDRESHKRFLINTYQDGKRDDSPFRNATFDEGIRKLKEGLAPKMVENWVENLFNAWANI